MRQSFHVISVVFVFLLVTCPLLQAKIPEPTIEPLVRVVDLDVGQTQEATLDNGQKVSVTLLDLKEKRDSVRNAVRKAQVKVRVNGEIVSMVSSTYHLPLTVGDVQIDCSVTKGYLAKSSKSNAWGLLKDARIRLWPADSPLIRPGTFAYPAGIKWFSSDTQMANVPCYVDGGELPSNKNIYYHYGLDFGGSEGMVDVLAATDGLVVSAAGHTLEGYEDTPVSPRYDVVYVLDARGWFYRYSHMQMIATPVYPGKRVK
ncbi:MAG: metalloendopeptidase, partial [Planctomycetes bacterium]|nr:metalloendopeptidase [Planctomycetota bacterium]